MKVDKHFLRIAKEKSDAVTNLLRLIEDEMEVVEKLSGGKGRITLHLKTTTHSSSTESPLPDILHLSDLDQVNEFVLGLIEQRLAADVMLLSKDHGIEVASMIPGG